MQRLISRIHISEVTIPIQNPLEIKVNARIIELCR
jgi:hypothetical protein